VTNTELRYWGVNNPTITSLPKRKQLLKMNPLFMASWYLMIIRALRYILPSFLLTKALKKPMLKP